jgi:hypothetical protein
MYTDRIDTDAGYDFANDDPDPEDDHGHGSHVAGIAVGRTGLSVTLDGCGPDPFQGIAPAATLIGIKVLDAFGGGSSSDIIAGIDRCADPDLPGGPADVINLSIGTGQFSGDCDGQHSWADAGNNAVDAGVVVVAAAGNEGYTNALASPACGSKVMAVGASYDEDFPSCEHPDRTAFIWCLDSFCLSTCTDSSPQTDELICFSNQSDDLDVAAPGCAIWSADFSVPNGNAITWKCGTSMSSPHVAGLAALLLSQEPSLNPYQVRTLIRSGSIDLGAGGFDRGYGYGRIDVISSLMLEPPICDGDNVCETGEDCNGCPNDCFSGSGASCGNGLCEAGDGEDCISCPQDCNGKQNGKPSKRFCCGDGGLLCDDSRCTSGGFSCTTDPAVASCCGDGTCEGSEDSLTCAIDCPPPICPDGTCDAGEDSCSCPQDCGTPPTTESNCTDEVDNDCDSLVDCSDVVDCGTDPACTCGQLGDSCTSDADCCSSKCKGKPGRKTCK